MLPSSAHVRTKIPRCGCKLDAQRLLPGAQVDVQWRRGSSDPFRSVTWTPFLGSHGRTFRQSHSRDAVRRRSTCFRKLASWMCAPMGTANARRGDLAQVSQDRYRLSRQRYPMGAPHLHLLGGNAPDCTNKIKLGPFRLAQFPWSDKNVGARRSAAHVVGCPSKPSIARNSAPMPIGSTIVAR
jgi:hypothetical protein